MSLSLLIVDDGNEYQSITMVEPTLFINLLIGENFGKCIIQVNEE